MSKASEWAKRYSTARAEVTDLELKRPEGAWLKVEPGRTITVYVSNDGTPRVESPLIASESASAQDLCDFARQILHTFSDEPAR